MRTVREAIDACLTLPDSYEDVLEKRLDGKDTEAPMAVEA